MKRTVMSLILFATVALHAQIERVEPPNWWVGFKAGSVQLLVKGPNVSSMQVSLDYPGVTIGEVHKADSPNYLFIDLNIEANAKPGTIEIVFEAQEGNPVKFPYELKRRKKGGDAYSGFDSSDVIYLITPDRFANGDPGNDIVEGLLEQRVDRNDNYARHGGDIRGIIDHLDYIDDMGFSAIWPCPMLTNDMPKTSYHGYAITDLYQIDPRFGTLGEYLELSKKSREKGIKLVMDQVANHCGREHWWMRDLPFKDWVNYQEELAKKTRTFSNHRRTANQDIYASDLDKKEMNDGWFVESMPDLNQRNPFMAKYLIQNSIWWIETAELGGIRQDTYPYSDKDFMADWAGAIMNEYPNFSIVGEEWSYNPLLVGYWQRGARNQDGYESNLRSPMDFPMQKLLVEALKENEDWNTGLIKLYEGLANDFHYTSPKDLMIFPDNHDMDRIHTQLNEDVVLTKMALAYILTLPRIPQIYYGTEILMQNSAKPGDHGLIRTDFPGGWDGDQVNAFSGEGLNEDQKEMQRYLKKLLNYRRSSKAIHEGETRHFAPKNGIYVLFRSLGDETVVVIMNKNEHPVDLDLDRFEEMGLNDRVLHHVLNDEKFIWKGSLSIQNKGVLIFSTKS